MTALKRINLMPRKETMKKRLAFEGNISRDRVLVLVALPLALFFSFDYLNIARELDQKKSLMERTKNETDNLNRQLKMLNLAPGDTKKAATAPSFAVKDVLDKKTAWTNPLRELSALIPDGVWLSKLNGSYDRTGSRMLVVRGSAGSEKMVSNFYSRLEKSFHMRNVDMSFAERQKNTVPLLYNFEFKVRLSKGDLKEPLKSGKRFKAKAATK